MGEPVCSCCGDNADIQEHHLYLRGDGCPGDLTIWLCHTCHMRAHGRGDGIGWQKAHRAGIERARAAGALKGRREDTERNAGIASLLAEGRSWSFIQDMTGCSRATVAKVAKRAAAA